MNYMPRPLPLIFHANFYDFEHAIIDCRRGPHICAYIPYKKSSYTGKEAVEEI